MAEQLAGLGHWRFDVATGAIAWSAETFHIHGLSLVENEPDYEALLSLYLPEDAGRLDSLVKRAISQGEPYSFAGRIRRLDGEIRHVAAKAQCQFDNDGACVAIFGVFQDVTEHLTALERAEAAVRRAELAEEIGGLGNWRLEFPSRSLTCSEQMYHICGLAPSQPVDVDQVMALIHAEDRLAVAERLRGDVAGNVEAERAPIRILRPGGEVRWVVGQTHVEHGPDGSPLALFGTLRDVTRETQAERRREESEARYRRLADHSTDVIVVIGMNGDMEYVSAACATFGYTPEELIGCRTIDMVHPDDRPFAIKMVTSLLAGEPIDRAVRREYRLRCKDGAYRWIEGNPTFIPAPEGEPPQILTIYRDVTVRRALEDELMSARAEAERASSVKSEFLANMSHELRTPLTSILGFSELLAPAVAGAEDASRYVDRVATASRVLLATVNDILDFSKLEAGQVEIEMRPVNVHAFAQDTVELLAPQADIKKLKLVFECSHDVPQRVVLDETRVRQVLLNLLSNAVKFTYEGQVKVTLSTAADGALLRCDVKDTGGGIPPERIGQLFKRFSQVDASTTRLNGGTGLGLAICKGLIEAMNGRIGVDSVVGQGSVFWFELPLILATDSDLVAPARHDGMSSLAGLRLLVCDDNPANLELVRIMLEAVDVEVTEASSGEEAVSLAKAWPFDVILMDLRMPGLDGYVSASAIKAGPGPNTATPILAFSADVDQGQERPDRTMFEGRVAKPIVASDLFDAVHQIFDAYDPSLAALYG